MSRRRAAIDFTAAMADVHSAVRSIQRRTDNDDDDDESSEGEYLDEAGQADLQMLEPRAKRPHLDKRRRHAKAAQNTEQSDESENETENDPTETESEKKKKKNEKKGGRYGASSSSSPPSLPSTAAEAMPPACYGNSLPGDVLLQIFSKLPLHDRKQASFTCRQWSRFAWVCLLHPSEAFHHSPHPCLAPHCSLSVSLPPLPLPPFSQPRLCP